MKSYTDLEQSKKLAEILSIESADMCLTFVNNIWNPVWGKADDIYQLQKDCYEPDYTKDEYVDFDEFEPKVIPCWSLTALLEILPNPQLSKDNIGNDKVGWMVSTYPNNCRFDSNWNSNAIDSCVEMILKLHKFKML